MKKDSTNDYFVFPYFSIKGHANNGSKKECIQVCSTISACVIGLTRLIDYTQYSVIEKSGVFEIKSDGRKFIDRDTCYALNYLWCILYDLWKMYPNQFSKFEVVERKEIEENYGKDNTKPKPFRKLKKGSTRMGFPCDQ